MAIDLEKGIIEVMDDTVPALLVSRASTHDSIFGGCSGVHGGTCFSTTSSAIGVSALLSTVLGVGLPIMSCTIVADHEDFTEEPLRWSYTAQDEVGDSFGGSFGGALQFYPRISL